MSGQIFISYRREDAAPWARLVYDGLFKRFPQNQIFIDVDNIDLGIDFVKAIEKSVGSCDVLIAVMGRRWLLTSDQDGRRRLDNPEDFVRVEIRAALKRGIRVIPVLVEGATMPRSGELPEDLKPLARLNALNVSHERFRADAERLIGAVERALEAARTEQQRNREEEERLAADRREREEKERLEAERREREGKERQQAGQREIERPQQEERERLEAEGRQKETPALEGKDAGPRAPPLVEDGPKEDHRSPESPTVHNEATGASLAAEDVDSPGSLVKADQPPSKEARANLKKRWRLRLLLIVFGSGGAIVLLNFGLFNRPAKGPIAVGQPSASPTPSPADGLAEAKRYLEAKDYAKALPLLQKAAAAGDAEAMSNLAELYRYGWGVARDYAQAYAWYQKAAAAGNAEAMYWVGVMYEQGRGVAQDYAQAREWYQKVADAGNAWGMYKLGWLYEQGRGVTQDYVKAREWYQKAADAGNTSAKEALSRLPSK
jgi:TPR repeat protein